MDSLLLVYQLWQFLIVLPCTEKVDHYFFNNFPAFSTVSMTPEAWTILGHTDIVACVLTLPFLARAAVPMLWLQFSEATSLESVMVISEGSYRITTDYSNYRFCMFLWFMIGWTFFFWEASSLTRFRGYCFKVDPSSRSGSGVTPCSSTSSWG